MNFARKSEALTDLLEIALMCVLFAICFSLYAVAEDNRDDVKAKVVLQNIETKYAKASSVEMTLVKNSENKLLKKKKTSKGKLLLKAHGLFRMDLDEPEKSSVILDGKKLWVIQYPVDPDFDKIIHVTVSKNPKKIQTPVLTTFLMGKGSLLDDFKISKGSIHDHVTEIELLPKKANADIKLLVIQLDEKQSEIRQITIKDNVDNTTEYDFDNVKFNGEIPTKTFEYSAPKDAEVNEM